MTMRLTCLGTGGAFSLESYHANLVVEHDGKRLLLDAGSDLRLSLRDAGLSGQDIDGVFISHLHGDHVGGLEYLGFTRLLDGGVRPRLYGERSLLETLWEGSLRGGMDVLIGKQRRLDDYFDLHGLGQDEGFRWEGLSCELAATLHVSTPLLEVPSYGLLFGDGQPGHTVFYTGDTQFTPERLAVHYDRADLIFHDCETLEQATGVHAHYLELVTLPRSIKEKMYLWHTQDNVVRELDVWRGRAASDGFRGFLIKGQTVVL